MNTYNKRTQDEDEDKRIVPDGGSVRVSMMALDSVQRQVAAIDERVQHNIDAGKATLAAARRDSDRARGFADHYTAQRAAHIDHSVYGDYTRQLSNAWMVAA